MRRETERPTRTGSAPTAVSRPAAKLARKPMATGLVYEFLDRLDPDPALEPPRESKLDSQSAGDRLRLDGRQCLKALASHDWIALDSIWARPCQIDLSAVQ
jgi:hypothetical protein